MMTANDLLRYKPYFMDERQLEKDYLQSLLLYEIYTDFSSELVFKGGTALKFFYGLNRFSEDLDFTYTAEKTRGETIERFDRMFRRFDSSYKVQNLANLERRGTKTSLDYELKIKGPLYEKNRAFQNIEVNISLREAPLEKPVLLYLNTRYQDIPVTGIYLLALNEMLAEKVRAVLVRKSTVARDIYDIYYLMRFKGVEPDLELINKKLAVYNISFSAALLISKIEGLTKMEWKSELSNILKDVPDYDEYFVYLCEKFKKIR